MQNNQTAAAASSTPAAAANLSKFENLCAIINTPIYDLKTNEDIQALNFCGKYALDKFASLTGNMSAGFDDMQKAAGFQTPRDAMRIFRKAAAAEICGLADFWTYARNAAMLFSVRESIADNRISEDDFRERDFFTTPAAIYGYNFPNFSPVVFDFWSNDIYRLAINGAGQEKPYLKADTFFCPILGKFASDTARVRVLTTDAALADAGSVYGNSLFMRAGATSGADCWQVFCSDFAISRQRDGAYIDQYRAFIFESEYQIFEVAEMVETGTFCHISEGHIWAADGLLHQWPAGMVCRPSDACNSYHAGNRLANIPVRFSRNAPYLAGFEVEKEDTRVKCSITARDFDRALPNFRKERDGSLNSESGFEFITPPLELSPRNIKAYFEARPVAVAHINADFSTACGGHIHLSRRGFSGADLFNLISGHLPLLHALFPSRADGNNSRYCQAKSASQLLRDREKYQSVNIMPDRIEIRIFGAVRGLENLVWRAGLVLKMFKHAASNPAAGYDKLPKLFPHLKKVYTTPAEMEMLIKRVEKYARKFEAYRPNYGADIATGIITDAARFKTYRPASARKLVTDAAGRTFVKTA
jgi:hypothetical protein